MNWQDRHNPQSGGAEIHLHEIFGRLAGRGHDVTLLVSGWPGCEPRARVDGMDVHRVGRRYTFPLHVRGGWGRLRHRGFDVVVENINKLPLFTPLWMEPPVVGLVNHLFGRTAFREAIWPVAATVWVAERFLPVAYRDVPFHAVSESTAEDLAERGLDRSRMQVIYGAVDHDRYRPDPEVRPFDVPTFVYVGRLKRYKGLDVALRALARASGPAAGARLVVAGSGDDGERLRRVAAELGVDGRVTFPGYVSEERKVELLRRAWANLYPSPKEGWGLTNLEAAACGTPTVASDAPGLRESVLHGETGFLVPHDDAGAWARRLEQIAGDGDLRGRLSRGARRHARRFSWERSARETEASLARVAAGARTGEGPDGP